MFKQVYWITFWLLFLKLNSQVSIQLDSIVIESSSISDSSTYNFISTNNGLQHYQLKLSKYNLSNSAPSFRNLFCSVPALHVIEHDASGLQLSIASRGLNPNRSWEINMKQDGGDLSADPVGYPEANYTPPLQSMGAPTLDAEYNVYRVMVNYKLFKTLCNFFGFASFRKNT